ncbi:MAG: hypothetical protein GY820_09975 [Gammaproteobacteria bacterium]|nr:hypothetical protein [Gammaproteobacteria bacterium]
MAVKEIDLAGEAKPEQVIALLNDFKESGVAFEIYDSFYPSPSDPGAYICYLYQVINTETFGMTLGNHGWSGGIYQINEDVIVSQLLHIAKTRNGLKIEIEKASFFSHYEQESAPKNKKMNIKLSEIHA